MKKFIAIFLCVIFCTCLFSACTEVQANKVYTYKDSKVSVGREVKIEQLSAFIPFSSALVNMAEIKDIKSFCSFWEKNIDEFTVNKSTGEGYERISYKNQITSLQFLENGMTAILVINGEHITCQYTNDGDKYKVTNDENGIDYLFTYSWGKLSYQLVVAEHLDFVVTHYLG